MICPDIWKFETPNTSVSYKINRLSEEVHSNLNKKITSHYFNKLVSVLSNMPSVTKTFAEVELRFCLQTKFRRRFSIINFKRTRNSINFTKTVRRPTAVFLGVWDSQRAISIHDFHFRFLRKKKKNFQPRF